MTYRRLYIIGAMIASIIPYTMMQGQSGNPSQLQKSLIEEEKPKDDSRQGSENRLTTAQVDALIKHGEAAEAAGQLRNAIDDFASAAVSVSSFPKRDTLQSRLRVMFAHEMSRDGNSDSVRLDSLVAQSLDQAFQRIYDSKIPVIKANASQSGRVVLAEYATGTQCGPCWLHDRAYAALLKRYPATDIIVLAYHGGPGYPIAYGGDHLWSYIASRGVLNVKSLYKTETLFGYGDLGWVDGKSILGFHDVAGFHALVDSPNVPAVMYQALSTAIDQRLQQPPEARIDLTVTPTGVTDTSVAVARVEVRVSHIAQASQRRHLGIRLVLVEDTVRVTGFTNRRLQYSAVRTVAWFGTPRTLFSPIAPSHHDTTMLAYTFDIAALQRALFKTRVTDPDAASAFPDAETWRMQPRRLGIVAIVQDLDTREVLQSSYQRVIAR